VLSKLWEEEKKDIGEVMDEYSDVDMEVVHEEDEEHEDEEVDEEEEYSPSKQHAMVLRSDVKVQPQQDFENMFSKKPFLQQVSNS
jgi:hypothetical protein